MPDASAPESPPILSFRGVPIAAERPRGFVQVGTNRETGKSWARVYGYDRRTGEALPGFITYGYVEGTTSPDGEALDCYLGSDLDAETVYVVEQGSPDPELKLVFGVPDLATAELYFAAHVPEEMLVSIRPVPLALVQDLLGVTDSDVVEKAAPTGPINLRTAVSVAHAAIAVEKAAKLLDAVLTDGRVPEDHPCMTAPLSGVYTGVFGAGGWLGWIEPEPRPPWTPKSPAWGEDAGSPNVDSSLDWIAFVNASGYGFLWTSRYGGSGAVFGSPIPFERPAPELAQDKARVVDAMTREAADEIARAIEKHRPAATPPPRVDMRLVEKLDALRYALFIVLEPLDHALGEADTQGDFYSADRIREGMWFWMKHFRNVLLHHSRQGGVVVNDKVHVVECYQAPVDMVIEGSNVKRGTWLVGLHFVDDGLWQRLASGEIQAVSIEGLAERVPLAEVSPDRPSA